VFVMIELFYLFNCRSLQRSMFRIGVFSNAWVTVGVTVTIVLQMLFTYAAPMHELFGSASIGLEDWARILVLALVAWGIVGIEKTVRSRRAAVSPAALR
uniref:cation transporting ATPase C-terminal domain-containing protein n=1 Tax=Paraconexibacter sp. TaxID=2949640 RepID=UPI003569B41A